MNSLTYLYDAVFRRSLKRKQQPEASTTFLSSSSSTIEHVDEKNTHPNKKHNNGKSKIVNTTGDCNNGSSSDVAHDANKEDNKVSANVSKAVDEDQGISNKGKGRATITLNSSISGTR